VGGPFLLFVKAGGPDFEGVNDGALVSGDFLNSAEFVAFGPQDEVALFPLAPQASLLL
jgi:hypothetical protein